MIGDIKLEENRVTISALWLYVDSWDIHLSHPDRRRDGVEGEGFRRALVHNHNDGLSINYAGDYPGGVSIDGSVTFSGLVEIEGPTTFNGPVEMSEDVSVHDLTIRAIRRPRIRGINPGVSLPPSARLGRRGLGLPRGPDTPADDSASVEYEAVKLTEIIEELQTALRSVTERLDALEGR